MAITKSAYSSLEEISRIKNRSERREAIRAFCQKHTPMGVFLQYTYHPDVIFDLPAGPTPKGTYEEARHDSYATFYRIVKKLPTFGTYHSASRDLKVKNWAFLLGEVAPVDIPLLEAVKEKKLPWRTLNKKFIVQAIPELFPPETQREVEKERDEEEA